MATKLVIKEVESIEEIGNVLSKLRGFFSSGQKPAAAPAKPATSAQQTKTPYDALDITTKEKWAEAAIEAVNSLNKQILSSEKNIKLFNLYSKSGQYANFLGKMKEVYNNDQTATPEETALVVKKQLESQYGLQQSDKHDQEPKKEPTVSPIRPKLETFFRNIKFTPAQVNFINKQIKSLVQVGAMVLKEAVLPSEKFYERVDQIVKTIIDNKLFSELKNVQNFEDNMKKFLISLAAPAQKGQLTRYKKRPQQQAPAQVAQPQQSQQQTQAQKPQVAAAKPKIGLRDKLKNFPQFSNLNFTPDQINTLAKVMKDLERANFIKLSEATAKTEFQRAIDAAVSNLLASKSFKNSAIIRTANFKQNLSKFLSTFVPQQQQTSQQAAPQQATVVNTTQQTTASQPATARAKKAAPKPKPAAAATPARPPPPPEGYDPNVDETIYEGLFNKFLDKQENKPVTPLYKFDGKRYLLND